MVYSIHPYAKYSLSTFTARIKWEARLGNKTFTQEFKQEMGFNFGTCDTLIATSHFMHVVHKSLLSNV